MKSNFHIIYSILLLLLLFPCITQAQTQKQLTNIPSVYINTLDNSAVTSKNTYKYARMVWVDGTTTTVYDSVQIRGRGNSTWNMAKKPYRIKFAKKEKLMGKGHAKARSWTLMANCADKSMMRNALTTDLGNFAGLPFTPGALFVDFYLNNSYIGTYQISDQVDIRPHRVNIFDQNDYMVKDDTTNITGGYLLESTANTDFSGSYFYTPKGHFIRIHSPEDSIIKRQKNYIQNHVKAFENALYSDNFDDPQKGYRQYVDTASLVNWYISNEVAANPDGFWSTYFYKERNDPRLYWGPLWDNDISYCNTTRLGDVTQSLMADVGYGEGLAKDWVIQFWKDDWFAQAVSRRYKELYDAGLTDFMLHKVDSMAELLEASQKENYKVWNIRQRYYEEIKLYGTYDQYIQDLKTFISEHNDYLLQAFTSTMGFTADTTHYYRIFNKGFSNGVIDLYNMSVKERTRVCMYNYSQSRKSQQWVIKPVGNYFMLLNRLSGLALVDHFKYTPHSDFIMVVKADTADYRQLWSFVPQGHGGYYNMKNRVTQRTVNNSNSTSSNNNPILSYTSDGSDATSIDKLWSIRRDELITEPLPSAIKELSVEYALMYNPQTQEVHFISPNLYDLTFSASIISLNGQFAGQFQAGEIFNASALPAGTYIVSWTFGGKSNSTKFIKK